MKMLSCFSGIGAFEKALTNLGIKYDLVGFSEIDKYAVKSYCAIHGVDETLNLGDITKIDAKKLPKDIDLFTYGFPCQDISLSGKQKGMFNADGSLTRSGLFFEALRIIEEAQPRVAIAENVKNLVGKKFKEQFQVVLASLESAGYNNYWAVLNLKNFGIPQNRERVFIVSIRKDVDNGEFKFPKGFPLEIRLKDILESEVDEKYYLKQTADFFIKNSFDMEKRGNGFRFAPHVKNNADIAKTITTRAGGRMDDNFVIDIEGDSATFKFDSTNPFLIMQDGRVFVREATKQGYTEAFEGDSINMEQPNSKTRRDRVGKQTAQTLTTAPQQAVVERNRLKVDDYIVWDGFNQRVRADQSCVGTLTRNCGGDLKRNGQGLIDSQLRIRKLTPKECFRLMGFDDSDFEKAEAVNSNTQLYKQAGNSIGVPVLEHIFKALLECGALKCEL